MAYFAFGWGVSQSFVSVIQGQPIAAAIWGLATVVAIAIIKRKDTTK